MVMIRQAKPFALGELLSTPAALGAIRDSGQSPLDFLLRHAKGDWGEVSAGDSELNDEATIDGDRVHSAYRTRKGERIWVITDAGGACTTILLPDEY
ncbi:hypothetical protein ACFLSJ_08360 [Verrucomicrobiota bacterium]